MLGVWVAGLATILVGLWGWWTPGLIAKSFQRTQCREVVQTQSLLSRETLGQLLALPERSTKAAVMEILPQPYCRLAAVRIRSGVVAEREAYPLAFDGQTWVIVLYEGDEYAGYAFNVEE